MSDEILVFDDVEPEEERVAQLSSQEISGPNDFDADWYLREYPDVAASGMNPVQHFIQHGEQEGRFCSAAQKMAKMQKQNNAQKTITSDTPADNDQGSHQTLSSKDIIPSEFDAEWYVN